MTEIDKLMAGVVATFSKSEVVVLSIESKAYHEWVISLMGWSATTGISKHTD